MGGVARSSSGTFPMRDVVSMMLTFTIFPAPIWNNVDEAMSDYKYVLEFCETWVLGDYHYNIVRSLSAGAQTAKDPGRESTPQIFYGPRSLIRFGTPNIARGSRNTRAGVSMKLFQVCLFVLRVPFIAMVMLIIGRLP